MFTLVTGAASGLGRAIALRCAADGRRVLAVDRDDVGLAALSTAALSAAVPGAIETVAVDLSDAQLEVVLLGALPPDASVSGLVNAAGVSVGDSIDRVTDDDWELSFAINSTSPMRLTRALLPALRRARGASVVNVASPVALVGARKVSYAASKAAVIGLTRALARNLGPEGIRVNALLPGPTVTGMTADWSPEKQATIARQSPLGRLGRPEDVAGAVAFLLGPDSTYITGSVLDVTGGTLLGAHG